MNTDTSWQECEKCEIGYISWEGGWEDECYCFTCYHQMFPCPEWCPDRNEDEE